MKRLFSLISLMLVSLSISMMAQNHYEANIAVGGKAGYSLSRVMFTPSVPQSMQGGFLIGGAFRYTEEKNFGIIAEFNIEQRGWKEKFEGYDYKYNRSFTYVQIPLLTHIYFGNEHFNAFFNAGPELGFMLGSHTSANFDYKNIGSIQDFPTTNRYTDQFTLKIKNRFDYGISAGIGVEWVKDKKHSFNAECRAYYGLGNVFSSHKTDPFSGSNSLSIMFSLGYFYRLK